MLHVKPKIAMRFLIHNDADRLGYAEAWKQRFEPGLTLAQQNSSETCRHLIPVIPVRMIEAWMLADLNTLRNVLGTNLSAQELDLPNRAALVETIAHPKNTLKEAIQKLNSIRSRRRQPIRLDTKYEALARQIDLNRLFEVPAYKAFVGDLATTLEELHFIAHNSRSQILASTHL